jgi:hypothetical protein
MGVPEFVVNWITSLFGAAISFALLLTVSGMVLHLVGKEVLGGLVGAASVLLFVVTLVFYVAWRGMILVSERS